MIAPDQGFIVENYVGTYHMININDDTVIISDEYHPARAGEIELPKKVLFLDDFLTNNYMILSFSNIDMFNDDEIISFCNMYGLPISSCKVDDEKSGYKLLGFLDVSEEDYAQYNPYYRQDTMNREEFRRHVCTAKRIMQVKYEIENKANPMNLFQYLIPLLLYDQIALFDFDTNEPERHYISTIFQQYYLTIKNKYKDSSSFVSDLFCFFFELSQIHYGTNKVPISAKLTEALSSDFINVVYHLLSEIKRMNTVSDIVYDEYYNLSIPEDTILSDSLIETMYKIAPQVLADTINEFMFSVRPTLIVSTEPKKFRMDWRLNYLYEGLCMETMLMVSSNNPVKKCQNPTCSKFFTPNNGHSDKMYCSHECATLVAKRRQRMRDKQNPDRNRLPAGFQTRKKPNIENKL